MTNFQQPVERKGFSKQAACLISQIPQEQVQKHVITQSGIRGPYKNKLILFDGNLAANVPAETFENGLEYRILVPLINVGHLNIP